MSGAEQPPLAGLRVLDLSRMLAGPFCTALLADLGAEVVKIEPPGRGDDARRFKPHRAGESAYFMLINRGKKSITLNLKEPRAVDMLHHLAASADVLVENYRPGVAARLGADYATLGGINPRLVYASITGFGQDGPLAQRPAYDIIAQAMSGLMSITGTADGPPTRSGESIGDLVAGLYASWGILAALQSRERTGEGQHLDIAMTDSLFSMMITALSFQLYTGESPGRIGNRHPMSAPFDTYQARDGHVVIATAGDRMFARCAAAMGMPELAVDPRFITDELRIGNEPALRAIILEWTGARSVADAVAALDAAGVPASPVLSVAQAVASEHVAARGLLTTAEHPLAGEIPLVRQPVQFSAAAPGPVAPPPILGEHTDEILGRYMDADELAALKRDGVI